MPRIMPGKVHSGVFRPDRLHHQQTTFDGRGAVRNLDAWYKAFDVQPGDKLYLPPEARVKIW